MLKEDCLGNTKLGKYFFFVVFLKVCVEWWGKKIIEKDLKLGKVQLIQINS